MIDLISLFFDFPNYLLLLAIFGIKCVRDCNFCVASMSVASVLSFGNLNVHFRWVSESSYGDDQANASLP